MTKVEPSPSTLPKAAVDSAALGELSVSQHDLKYWAISFLLTAVYFGAAKFGLQMAFLHPSATPVWPPTGIALAAFLILGYRVWPAILVGAFLANLTTAGTVITSLGIAAGNASEGLLGSYLVNRYANGVAVFNRSHSTFRFVAMWPIGQHSTGRRELPNKALCAGCEILIGTAVRGPLGRHGSVAGYDDGRFNVEWSNHDLNHWTLDELREKVDID